MESMKASQSSERTLDMQGRRMFAGRVVLIARPSPGMGGTIALRWLETRPIWRSTS
jgi:hypothetical protein